MQRQLWGCVRRGTVSTTVDRGYSDGQFTTARYNHLMRETASLPFLRVHEALTLLGEMEYRRRRVTVTHSCRER
jgi:hypothetical protein